jgi:hypothetical protein
MSIPRQLLFAASLAASLAAPAEAQVILNEYNAVRADRWLGEDGADASPASDSYFGRVRGNGGRWFEVLVVGSTDAPGEKVDLRGWTFSWTSTDVGSGSFTLSQDVLWSAIDRGALITFFRQDAINPERVPTKVSYDPTANDWWININLEDAIPQYVQAGGTLDTGNEEWQLTIRDARQNITYQGGEEVGSLSGVNSREVGKLEAFPAGPSNTIAAWQSITSSAVGNYRDGTLSTFSAPNAWGSGDAVQDLSVLRRPVTAAIFQGAPDTVTLGGALTPFIPRRLAIFRDRDPKSSPANDNLPDLRWTLAAHQ